MLCDANGRWHRSNGEPHASIGLELGVCESAYEHLKLKKPRRSGSTRVSAMVDTGAQMCVADVTLAGKLGLPELVTPAMNVTVADNAELRVVGAGFVTLVAVNGMESHQMVYFANGVSDFYLSKAACRDLGVISPQFPESSSPQGALGVQSGASTSVPAPTSCAASSASALAAAMPRPPASAECSTSSSVPASVPNAQVKSVKVDEKGRTLASCGCLERTLPPEVPECPPFPCVPENAARLDSS